MDSATSAGAGDTEQPAGASRLRRWFDAARDKPALAVRALADLIYPPVCAACGAAVSEPHGVCAACWGRLSFITRPYCERLGTPFALDLGGALLSPAAMADPPVFARARAVCGYDDVARDLIHRLKYHDRLELTRLMAGLMRQAGAELLAEADAIAPIPLHRWRLWRRRFNQAGALADAIGAESGHAVLHGALLRVKATRPQVGLSRAERAANLQGAIRVPPASRPLVEGRRIVLVDDVLTTGATANAASRALLKAGASHVDVLTFARVIPGS
jgi:ComF family protein